MEETSDAFQALNKKSELSVDKHKKRQLCSLPQETEKGTEGAERTNKRKEKMKVGGGERETEESINMNEYEKTRSYKTYQK